MLYCYSLIQIISLSARYIFLIIQFVGVKQNKMQQYYLHNQFINNGQRKNIKPVKINKKNLICMSNDNVLEFYEFTTNGIRYHSKHSLNCNIAKIQILPTKQCIPNDYIFIIDKKGRYGFWNSQGGFQYIENSTIENEGSLYRNDDELQQVTFSGQIHHFDVFDTKGSVFFVINHTIVLIDYGITRIGIRQQKTRKMHIPYVQYRYINWIKSSKKGKFLGIIEQIQEKTILKVHNLENTSKITQQNAVYKKQKTNLFEFISQNDELILISDDQIIGLTINKPYHQIYNHKIHHASGKAISLSGQVHCYIGEEFLVFKKGYIKSYGSFKEGDVNIFQKKGVLQASYIKQTEDNGFMVCVSTLNNQTYFITLFENKWKLYYHLKALTSIYSIHHTNNINSIIAVMDQTQDSYQIVVVEKQNSVPLIKEQKFPTFVDNLISIDQGKFIMIGGPQANHVMRLNEKSSEFDQIFQLPKEKILTIRNNILVTQSGLYTISLETSLCEELARDDIILTASNYERVIYMSGEGQVKLINLELADITVLRDQAFDEYSWYLLQNNDLIVAKTSNLFLLSIYHDRELVSQIHLTEDCLISSIHHYIYESESIVEETIAVGYMNGSIYLYSMSGVLKAKFHGYCHEPVSFFSINSYLLGIISGSKQFVLSVKNNIHTINQIQFTKNGNRITALVFLQLTNQFLFVESDENQSGKLIRMISLSDVYDGINQLVNNHDSYRIKVISQNLTQIPTVFLYNSFILVGLSSSLNIYQLQTGRQLKTIKHYLKDVLGMFILDCGLVMYGIDSIERNLIYVYSKSDFEELCALNFILKDNKYIKTIREIPNSNRFVCRGQTFTTLCQLNFPKEINQIFEFKTDIQGYSLQIDTVHSLLGETDSKRLLMVLSYYGNILPIARYISPHEINDFLMLQRCILIGDKAGFLHLLEFNTEDPNEAMRMGMTKVASINVGEEVTTLSKRNSTQALYGTVSGRIGSIHIINEECFRLLKPAEEQSWKQLTKGCDFQYFDWRGRTANGDKLIDGVLVKQYLHENSKRQLKQSERSIFEEAHSLFERLTI